MLKLALRNVLAKKRRFIGTALSITLGIAFLTGTLVFTDTMGRTFDNLYTEIYAETDTVVRASSSVEDSVGFEIRGRIPNAAVDRVRAVDGVAEAVGSIEGWAQLVGADGDPVGNPSMGPPTMGGSFTEGVLNPWVLTEGSRAPGPGELVIDVASAEEGSLTIGDEVTVMTQTGSHVLPLVGTARFGSVDSPAGASVSLFDLATAQQLLVGGAGEVDEVLVDAAPGVGEDELTERIAAVLPDGQEAMTGSAKIAEIQDQVGDALSFFGTFLRVFAIIGLVVASFTIYNTFQIVITQRIREMALLRAIGASRPQVLGAQLIEAVVVGFVASIFGLLLGIGVAGLLKTLLASFGIALPAGGTVFLPRTAIVALVVGVVVTAGSAVFPAMRASRIPPVAALRDVALDRTGQTWRRLALGTVVTGIGVFGFVVGLVGADLLWVGIGALGVFLGVFVLGPLLTRPIAGPISKPLPAISGITGELARENALRNPKRTSRTGGALMVGVALVVGISVISASAKDWIRDIFGEQFVGDFVASSETFGFGGLNPDLAVEVAGLTEVDAVAGVRVGFAQRTDHDPGGVQYVAVDPGTTGQVFDIGVIAGSVESLDEHGVLLDDDEAARRGVAVGDQVTFEFVNGERRALTVEGLYTEQDLAGNYVVSHALHEWTGADQFDFAVYIVTGDGVSADAARTAIATVTDGYPNAELRSREQYLDAQSASIDPIVNLMYALLALAVGIALFSIANSMALSIHERTRELGLLRAVGMTRRQMRTTVRWESVLIALLGTGSGLVIGIFFGWAISVTIRAGGLTAFTVPVLTIVIVTALAVVGAMLVAIRPARQAARLDILHAIAAE